MRLKYKTHTKQKGLENTKQNAEVYEGLRKLKPV